MKLPGFNLFTFSTIMCAVNVTLFSSSAYGKEKIIQNIHLPSCRNCVHFIPNPHIISDSYLSKCSYFGKKDIITDEIKYDYAEACRTDENKCGKNGVFFQKEDDITISLKTAKHTIGSNLPLVLLYTIIAVYFAAIIHGLSEIKHVV